MSRRDFLGPLSAAMGAGSAPPHAADRVAATDTHAHIFTQNATLASNRRYAPSYDATLADYLAMLDRNGMSRGVLIQPSFLGTDNTYMLQALRAAPERLRGIAVVSPGIDGAELEALARLGVVGIRLNLIGQPDPSFATAVWNRHLAHLAALGWQVEIQAEARRLSALVPRLLAAGLSVVVDHFGRPDPALGTADPGFRYLLEAARTGRVWVKLSGAYRNGAGEAGARVAKQAAAMLLTAFGPGRLVWGSDWPHPQFETVASPAQALADFETWVPDPEARRTVLADAPARLFRFP